MAKESSERSTTKPVTASLSKTMVTNAKFDVEKFDGTNNFGMWQCEVLDILYQQELDFALEEEKPDDIEEKDWTRINRLACGTIRLCLSKEQKYPFMRETSAHKLWKELNKLYMRTKLYRFQYLPGTTMNKHITRFDSLVTDLLNLDENINDTDKALILLASLPDEYEHLIVSMLAGKETITFKEVTTALYSNEIRKKDKLEHKSSAGEAHTVRGRSQSHKPSRRGRSRSKGKVAKDECAFCHEKGHWKKDCPKLQKKKGKAVAKACLAENDESDYSLSCVSTETCTDEWLLDSGCSFHMCSRKEWFFNFEEIDGGAVYLADNQSHKIAGFGSIYLKNHDGSTRALTDVRYIPKFAKNLISLGALESKGFTINMQNGILKVISRALVVMKGVRKNNLYHYQGSTAVGIAAAAVEADKEAEMTKLWHMRLGHAGEKSLQTLAKQGLLKGAKNCKMDFCEQCVLGKQTRVKFANAIHNTKGHLINRLPSAALKGKTPLEVWSGKPAYDYDSLRVFGSTAYYHVKESKLDPRAKKALFMGVTSGVKGFRLWCLSSKKIISSKDVTFDESAMLKKVTTDGIKSDNTSHQPKRSQQQVEGTPQQVEFQTTTTKLVDDQRVDLDTPETELETREEEVLTQESLQQQDLPIAINDMLIASKNREEINRLKAQLSKEFEMKDLGEAKKILGMEITRDRKRGILFLTQKQYLKKLLQRFNITEKTKPVSTPLALHFKLSASQCPKTKEEEEYMSKVPYSNAVGSLMYAMVCTRPDISHAVGIVSRYMHNPGKEHWQAVKWILRYILKTLDVGLIFEKNDVGQHIVGYCDSDYAGDLDKCRSTTGYVFTLAKAPISWKSTLQSTVALSTTEAEYMAITEAVKEAIWLQGLLEDLGVSQKHIVVYCDSQSAIHLAKNQVYHDRTKHIDVRGKTNPIFPTKTIGSLIDVGGGIGETVSEIAKSYPHIKCINFDQPHVVATASKYEGVTHVGGDMFQAIHKADAVFMKWVMHDWSDENCVKILKKCKEAIPEERGKVIIVDFVLKPEGDGIFDDTGFVFDLLMIAHASGGRERTELEWKKVLQEAGFPRYNIITIKALPSIIEAYPI
ncbi:hypothetical protein L6164_016867 [Bauhinia variegata]|uniref:Uncharacterized protein n=1 Tax=Bauhinia variegata TaxID=167791 RepID=A0ACB9N9R3_BAUVA|nr:hypothetical protein L6164_016867 [Bauhinia variegata]